MLSDIHSNWIALQAVLREVAASKVDSVVCLGDLVGYGPEPGRCVETLRKIGAAMVMGNHEMEVLKIRHIGTGHLGEFFKGDGYSLGLIHSAKELNEEQAVWLAKRPGSGAQGLAMMAHANLEHPMGFDYIESVVDAVPSLEILRAKKMAAGFFGHTHMQEVFCDAEGAPEWLDEMSFRVCPEHPCVVMVGSVGQSRVEGDLRAAWAIWDEERGVVELRKTEYDRLAAARAILDAGLPMDSAARLLTDDEYKTMNPR